MAATLDNYDFAINGRYLWRQWLDGQIWELKQGQDFAGKPRSFANSARRAATQSGRHLDYAIDGDTVIIRARHTVQPFRARASTTPDRPTLKPDADPNKAAGDLEYL